MISRRSVGKLLAGAPFMRPSNLAAISSGAGPGNLGHIAQASEVQEDVLYSVRELPGKVPPQKMAHWQATRLALRDPDLRREIVSEMYERNKVINIIDPDIEVIRSFSPMAKITFQRQRNVEREIERMTADTSIRGRVAKKLQDFMNKAMWGEGPVKQV